MFSNINSNGCQQLSESANQFLQGTGYFVTFRFSDYVQHFKNNRLDLWLNEGRDSLLIAGNSLEGHDSLNLDGQLLFIYETLNEVVNGLFQDSTLVEVNVREVFQNTASLRKNCHNSISIQIESIP
jgi:hypothetical protein